MKKLTICVICCLITFGVCSLKAQILKKDISPENVLRIEITVADLISDSSDIEISFQGKANKPVLCKYDEDFQQYLAYFVLDETIGNDLVLKIGKHKFKINKAEGPDVLIQQDPKTKKFKVQVGYLV